MAVCKFFLEGRCKFGERCKFEHPRSEDTRNQNTFGAFARPDNNQARGPSSHQSPAGPHNQNRSLPYYLKRDIIREDLTKERPMWIMSSYGPGRDAPTQLFGGFPLEQSPEEIRTLHYLAVASGNLQQSAQAEQELAATANQQVQSALNDLDGAIQYIINGAKSHPNRLDFCAQNQFAQQALLALAATQNAGAFGQPQPVPGQAPPSAPNAFGQPPAQIFGATPNPQSQPSGFAQPPSFGQPQQAPQFGNSTFGNTNTFGQSMQQPTKPAFGQQSQPNSTFGQSQSSTPNTFGKPLNPPTLGNAPTFGQSTGGATTSSSFPISSGSRGGGGPFTQDISSYSTRDTSTNRLLTWKSRPVIYLETGEPCFRQGDGSLERIWFPDGAPTKFQADDLGEVVYPGDEGSRYQYLREQGTFEGGVMPEVPPRVDDIRWDI